MNIIKLFKKNQSKLICLVCLVIIILLSICLRKSNRIDTFYFQDTNVYLNAGNYDTDKFPFDNDGIRDYSSVTHIPNEAFMGFPGNIILRNLNQLETIGDNALTSAAGFTDSAIEITD